MRIQIVSAAALASWVGAAALADVIASTSFEEPGVFPGVRYTDLDDPGTDHPLADNPDEPFVNYVSIGGELGFTSFYYNTRDDVGLTDGDFVGVTDFVGTVGAYTDGLHGFQFQDADGAHELTLDSVDISGAGAPAVLIDVFVRDTTWETDAGAFDSIRIWVEMNDGTEIDILNTIGSDIDDLGIEGFWMETGADLTGFTSATLKMIVDCNAAAEEVYIDNVRFCDNAGGDEICPDTATILAGEEFEGGFGDVCAADDVRWVLRSTTFAAAFSPDPINVEFEGNVSPLGGNTLTFSIEGHPDLAGGTAFIQLRIFNYTTQAYEGMPFPGQPDGTDMVYSFAVDNSAGDYVDVLGNIKAQVAFARTTTGPVLARLDQVFWTLE